MRIFVREPAGRTLTLEVEQTDTIESVKSKLVELEGIPLNRQRLHFNNRLLLNALRLFDYNIQRDSTLTLVAVLESRPILREWARGEAVRELQTLLVSWGYLRPAPIDGIFGPLTLSAVMAFQRNQGIAIDGVVGPITWNALLSGGAEGPPVIPPPSYFEYTVQRGDSLWLLAQRFGTTVDAIKSLNGLDSDLIFIGQTLRIPDEGGTDPQLPPAVTPPQNRPTLRMGSRGEAVTELQLLLSFRGYLPGPIDGIFGPMTQSAVTSFQRDQGLAVDGIVGPITWNALLSGIPWKIDDEPVSTV